jgi:hypothetical protein
MILKLMHWTRGPGYEKAESGKERNALTPSNNAKEART